MTEPRWPADRLAQAIKAFTDSAELIPPGPGPGSTLRAMHRELGHALMQLEAERAINAKLRRKR